MKPCGMDLSLTSFTPRDFQVVGLLEISKCQLLTRCQDVKMCKPLLVDLGMLVLHSEVI